MGTHSFCPSRTLIPGERFPCEAPETVTGKQAQAITRNAYADYLERKNRAASRGMIQPKKKR